MPPLSTFIKRQAPALLLFSLWLLASGCTPAEDGKIPCIDDSSCPRDYPACVKGVCTQAAQECERAEPPGVYKVDYKCSLPKGTGTFTPAPGSPHTTGSSPSAVAAADFDRDAFLDLAVANQGSSS